MSDNSPPYGENIYQSRPTESYHGDSRLHAVTEHLSDPTAPELSMPNFVTTFPMLKTTANTSLQCLPMEGHHGDGTNMVEPFDQICRLSVSSSSQRDTALADDELFIQESKEKLRKEPDRRMRFVWSIIAELLDDVDCDDCLKRRELWLRIIEGDDDDDDDLWLWVDGDEEWLTKQNILPWVCFRETDWLSAQSALRRRIARKRYPPATAQNKKVRNATPIQRAYVIAWLIASSKAVAELFTSHGRTPPAFRIPKIADTLSSIIYKYWNVFPSQTEDWKSALKRSKKDGCICSPAECRGLRKWLDMMVWLEVRTPTLVVGDKRCVRCRSLLESRYAVIATECTVTSHVSLVDVFYNYCRFGHRFSRSLSPTTKRLVDRKLDPLLKKHRCDVRFSPPVNRFPQCLRPIVAGRQCGSHINSERGLPISGLPDNVFVGANDPWVVLGIIAWARCGLITAENTDLHDEGWHGYFSTCLHRSLDCFDMPALPQLSSTGFTLCHALDQDNLEEGSLDKGCCTTDDSKWVKSDQDGRQVRLATAVMVAVATFLRNKKDVDLRSCGRCRVLCTEFFAGIPSAVGFDVANSGDRDNALGRGLSPPLERSLELGRQEPIGMEASTSMLRNPALSKDEIHSQLIGELRGLRQRFDFFGLDIYKCLQRFDSGSKPCRGEGTLPRHLPGRSISSSSTLSKSDKVEEIKNKLLEILREHDLSYERLPWYTLEKDLEKHGFTLVNWPPGVLRKRGNRGIHDLSAVEVNSLYEAIMFPDESRRLRICRCPSKLTVVPVDNTPVAASGSKRSVEELDSSGHPSKRIKFKDMTSKVSQQQLSDLRADAASGS